MRPDNTICYDTANPEDPGVGNCTHAFLQFAQEEMRRIQIKTENSITAAEGASTLGKRWRCYTPKERNYYNKRQKLSEGDGGDVTKKPSYILFDPEF